MSVTQATILPGVLRQCVCVTDKIKVHVHTRELSRSQNWLARPWPDPTFWHEIGFFQEDLLKNHLLCA